MPSVTASVAERSIFPQFVATIHFIISERLHFVKNDVFDNNRARPEIFLSFSLFRI